MLAVSNQWHADQAQPCGAVLLGGRWRWSFQVRPKLQRPDDPQPVDELSKAATAAVPSSPHASAAQVASFPQVARMPAASSKL
jgi:hypothetical protein